MTLKLCWVKHIHLKKKKENKPSLWKCILFIGIITSKKQRNRETKSSGLLVHSSESCKQLDLASSKLGAQDSAGLSCIDSRVATLDATCCLPEHTFTGSGLRVKPGRRPRHSNRDASIPSTLDRQAESLTASKVDFHLGISQKVQSSDRKILMLVVTIFPHTLI